MSYIEQQMKAMQAWGAFCSAYAQMLMSAQEVILRRTHQMATGIMTGPEATGMVLEKMTAMATATERAAVAAAKGGNPLSVATAALEPYRRKTRANARRLRK